MWNLAVAVCGILLLQHAAAGQTAPAVPTGFGPMTQGERFHHFVTGTFSVESIIRSTAGAGILQWTDTPEEWGQGAEGYGRRLANSYGQHIMRQTLMYGAADILHEDNRYFPSERSGVMPRIKYAVESTFLARKDDGTRRFSYSRMGSYAAVAFISREWQPHSTSGAEDAVSSLGIVVASEVGFNVVREFAPRLFHWH